MFAANEASPAAGLGVQVFAGNCANCHDWDGKGVQSPYANLLGSRTVNDPDATNLMAILLAGSSAPLPVEHAFMPPFARGHNRLHPLRRQRQRAEALSGQLEHRAADAGRDQGQQVAWMERSEIRERSCRVDADPDFTPFHPGYARSVNVSVKLRIRRLAIRTSKLLDARSMHKRRLNQQAIFL